MPYKHQVIPLQAHEGNETAEQALHSIVDGFKRFRNEVFPQQEELFKKLATAQNTRHVHHLRRLARGAGADHPELARRPVRQPQRR